MLKSLDKERQTRISEMTLEEKATLVGGSSIFGSTELSKRGIRRLQFLDGGTGLNFEQLIGDLVMCRMGASDADNKNGMELLGQVCAHFYEPELLDAQAYDLYVRVKEWLTEISGLTEHAPGCYPPGMLLGATFSPETVYAVGQALGLEATIYGVDFLLGTPNVNIHRDPKNGRLFEGYSEDPCLVSVLAPELVKGVQEYPVIANVKHFAANNQETNRIGINEIISERALREIYLPGFMACVKAGVQSVMSAYNRINGIACTENAWLLQDVLRGEWGFSGTVVSDWGAVYDPARAIACGNDLNMPGPTDAQPVIDAVKTGALDEKALDAAVYHYLSTADAHDEKIKAFRTAGRDVNALWDEAVKKGDTAAYAAAKEGIVLLKNEREIFPILPDGKKQVALCGSGRSAILTCGTGSAGIITNRNTSLYTELCAVLGEGYVNVYDDTQLAEISQSEIVLVVASLSGMEGNDRKDLRLAKSDRGLLAKLTEKKHETGFLLGLLLNVCGPVELSEYEPDLDGIFCMFLPGMQGARAMAELICGRENPSGKLPLTFPKKDTDTPTYVNFPGDGGQVMYGEGIFVGYRYYEKTCTTPMYPFGYGMSYTTFAITGVAADGTEFDDRITVTGTIQNTGARAGAQVVQLYVADIVSTQPKPVKELRRFKKIYLRPGESKRFVFELTEQDFCYFDADYKRFLCEEGFFDLIVAVSSAKRDEAARIRVYKRGESPYSYGLQSQIKVLFEKEELREALLAWWREEMLDVGILRNAYQYTSGKCLREFVPETVLVDAAVNPKWRRFMQKIACVQKP